MRGACATPPRSREPAVVPVGIEMSLSRSGTLAFGENPRPANVAPAAIPIGWECVASVEIPHRSAHIARSNRDFEKLTGVHRQGSRDRLADMEHKTTPPACTGDMIAGWRLGRHVGEGGFATVWGSPQAVSARSTFGPEARADGRKSTRRAQHSSRYLSSLSRACS